MRRTRLLNNLFIPSACLLSSSRKTYLFYDLETTGLSHVFAQIVRFAAIRTTTDFREIEKHEISVRLRSDVVVEPGAAVVNHLGPTQLQEGESEYEAAKRIHQLVNQPGTISLGYNSLAFDDLFLRFLFFRNFLNPYSHQRNNHCGRMDVYPITVIAFHLNQTLLKWRLKDGTDTVSFKLEDINAENKLCNGRAHDAMIDTRITLELAKILSKNKTLWNECEQCFDKETDKASIKACASRIKIGNEEYKIAHLINHRSAGNPCTPVLLLGESIAYSNQVIFLKMDSLRCESAPINKILDNAKIIRKKYGQAPFFRAMSAGDIKKFQDMFLRQLQWLSNNRAVLPAIRTHFLNKRYEEVVCDPYAQLYQLPLSTSADEALFKQFHAAESKKKLTIASQFPQPAHQTLALRFVGNHFPESLSSAEHKQFEHYVRTVFKATKKQARIDYKGDQAITISNALDEIQEKRQKPLNAKQKQILDDCENWLTEKAATL